MASNIYGMTGLIGSLAANNYDLYGTSSLPSTWTGGATKSSSVSNPYGSLSYSDPGNYQSYDNWASWQDADKTYRNQYADNGYSVNTAKSMYTQPSGGDWATYQQSLQQPGEIAAKQAYDKSKSALEEWAGAGGLYGSSVMTQQAKDSVYQPYMDTMATNAAKAASTRYAAEDSSNQYLANLANSIYGTRTSEWGNIDARNLQEALAQNQFNQTQDSQQATQQQALNAYNLSKSNSQNSFNLNSANGNAQWNQWATGLDNGLLKEGYNNATSQVQWADKQNQQIYDNNYKLWNNINPTEEEKTQNETASMASSREQSESGGGLGGLLSGGLSALGTIGGYGTGGGSTIAGGLWNSFTK